MSIRVVLPWPARALWPNSRPHWAVKNSEFQTAKWEAYAAVKAALNGRAVYPTDGPIRMTWEFQPPRRTRRYDLDNVLSACKAASDGIALALAVDDVKFVPYLLRGDPCYGGRVVVTIGG